MNEYFKKLADDLGISAVKLEQALAQITQSLHITLSDIQKIKILKTGMTNKSFMFSHQTEQYIMRLSGKGSEKLINRHEESAVYQCLSSLEICDEVVFFDEGSGNKLSRYIPNSRVCDPKNWEDVTKSMQLLHKFHQKELKVSHTFDVIKQINLYESLWQKSSQYPDYKQTKSNVLSLQNYIEKYKMPKILCHIDAVSDNFLFYPDEKHKENIRLIDWEYAGMQDPHIDIAAFGIYSLYTKEEMDKLINCYFSGQCSDTIRIKIYCYIAQLGLCWSNWCEYKSSLGVHFGEYSPKQYQYAKEYYKYAIQKMKDEYDDAI